MSKKRGNSEGTVFQRGIGSWRAQVTLEGRRLSHTAKTRQDCLNWLKKTIAQVDSGLTFAGAQTFLEEFLLGLASGYKAIYPASHILPIRNGVHKTHYPNSWQNQIKRLTP